MIVTYSLLYDVIFTVVLNRVRDKHTLSQIPLLMVDNNQTPSRSVKRRCSHVERMNTDRRNNRTCDDVI